MHNNNERNILSKRFSNYGSTPSKDTWGAIEKRLDRDKNIFTSLHWGLNIIAIVMLGSGIIKPAYLQVKGLPSDSKNTTSSLFVDNDRSSQASSNKFDTKSRYQNEVLASSVELNSPDQINAQSISENDASILNNNQKEIIQNTPVTISRETEAEIKPQDSNENGKRLKIINNLPIDIMEKDYVHATITTPIEPNPHYIIVNNLMKQELDLFPHYFEIKGLSTSHLLMEGQKPYPPKWEFDLRGSTFFNVGTPRSKSYVDAYSWDLIPEEAPDNYAQNYARYIEIQTTFSRRLGMRFRVSLGVSTSFSMNEGYSSNGQYPFKLSQLTFGLPVEIGYTAFQFRRFSITPYIGILNELNNHLNKLSTPTDTQLLPSPINEVDRVTGSGYSFALQPSIELSFYTSENSALYLSTGYRQYLYSKSSGVSPGLLQPNYIQAAIGLRWILR